MNVIDELKKNLDLLEKILDDKQKLDEKVSD